jgi:hypothetical protein
MKEFALTSTICVEILTVDAIFARRQWLTKRFEFVFNKVKEPSVNRSLLS